MPLYETVFIARQDLSLEDVDSMVNNFSKVIKDREGEVASKEYWGLRNLAYPIKKNTRGHHVLLNISSTPSALAELKRIMGYNENIIRFIVILVPNHQKQSPLFLSVDAKDYKPGKTAIQKEISKIDLVLDRVQFDV
jgi:small subunit ribosomal protein S6